MGPRLSTAHLMIYLERLSHTEAKTEHTLVGTRKEWRLAQMVKPEILPPGWLGEGASAGPFLGCGVEEGFAEDTTETPQ